MCGRRYKALKYYLMIESDTSKFVDQALTIKVGLGNIKLQQSILFFYNIVVSLMAGDILHRKFLRSVSYPKKQMSIVLA